MIFCVNGRCLNSHCSNGFTARSAFGMIHGGVRWNRFRCETRGAICGTNWIALAPVPITATRLPSSEYVWSQCCEWNALPLNFSMPGMFGMAARDSPPIPEISTRADHCWPFANVSCQRWRVSS